MPVHRMRLASLPLDDKSVNYKLAKNGGIASAARLICKAGISIQIVEL
jgi:hypothetical protein